jgi:hypothetical protein
MAWQPRISALLEDALGAQGSRTCKSEGHLRASRTLHLVLQNNSHCKMCDVPEERLVSKVI